MQVSRFWFFPHDALRTVSNTTWSEVLGFQTCDYNNWQNNQHYGLPPAIKKKKFSSVICQSSVSIKRLTSACWFEVRGIHCTSKWILDRIQIVKIPPHWRSVLYANTHVRTWEILEKLVRFFFERFSECRRDDFVDFFLSVSLLFNTRKTQQFE